MKQLLAACATLTVAFVGAPPADAHGGRLNAQGCHHQRSTGAYHCHRAQGGAPSTATSRTQGLSSRGGGGGAFANCAAARAAGAAPCGGVNRAMDRIWTGTTTASAASDGKMTWLRRLHRAWTRNDGKPREDWAPGPDLKEAVMIGVLAVLTGAQVAGIVLLWLA